MAEPSASSSSRALATALCLLLHLSLRAAAAMDPAEREALLRVMEAVSSDRDWREAAGADPCSSPWPGLECKPAPAGGGVGGGGPAARMHVARLDFGVPPNPTCKDTATFPLGAFALPELRALFLVDCFKNPDAITAFTLPPPANLSASRLQQLSVRSNPSLSGTLPPQLASIRSLQVLTVSQNALIRGEELRLANSGLSGSIPETFGLLSSLTTLSLENNNLTGQIPAGLSRLKRMYHLNLSKNGLDGVVPFDGAFLRQLGRNLDLSGNPGLCVADRAVVPDVGVGVCAGDAARESSAAAGSSAGGAIGGEVARGRWPAGLLRPSAVALCCCLLL
ncbi:piriformospora indica-insensitive protein 2-like [Panicum miliaceum]|uniref:Piriformospora indica-insensitive protein 2-like n=1 Tax=Panicum miliaceum TaxID=4540 RepID=A0A3L6STS0_PANMI|nr:piriformospora indica-insensitive protein 2-like [Panicum miliaceum]